MTLMGFPGKLETSNVKRVRFEGFFASLCPTRRRKNGYSSNGQIDHATLTILSRWQNMLTIILLRNKLSPKRDI